MIQFTKYFVTQLALITLPEKNEEPFEITICTISLDGSSNCIPNGSLLEFESGWYDEVGKHEVWDPF